MATKKSPAAANADPGTPSTTASTVDATVAVANDGSWDARDAIAPRAIPGQEPGGPPAGITRAQAAAGAGRTSTVRITRATVANGVVVAAGEQVEVTADEAAQLIQSGKASAFVDGPIGTSAAEYAARVAAGLVANTGLTATSDEAARPKSMGVADDSPYATADGIAAVAPNAVAADPLVDELRHGDPATETATDAALRTRAA